MATNVFRTRIMYDSKNPYDAGVTHVVIDTESKIPYVSDVRRISGYEIPPSSTADSLVLTVKQAKKLFDFEKCDLEKILRQNTVEPLKKRG